MSTKYFVGDIAKQIPIDIGEDVHDATTVRIKYRKPNNQVGYWDAVVDTADSSIIYHSLDSTDLDIPGLWKLQPYVVLPSGSWTGHEYYKSLLVYGNLDEVYLPSTSTSIYQNLNLVFKRKVFSCDGVRTIFTLDSAARPDSLFLFANGVLMRSEIEYTVASDRKTITTINVLDDGWLLDAQYTEVATTTLTAGYQSVLVEFGRDVFVADGSVATFTLSHAAKENSLIIYFNGILAQKDVDYTEGSEYLTFTYTTPPDSGAIIEARYVKQ